MERKKRKVKFRNILLIFYTIINIVFVSFIFIINILPNKYLYSLLGVIVLLYLIIFILVKKKKRIGYILLSLFTIIYIFIAYYLGVTQNFFSSFNNIHYNEETYLVIVLKDSKYTKIKDLNNKTIGYFNNNINDINKVLEKLDNSIKKESYNSDIELFKNINNNNIEAILIEESYYNIKNEEENLDNYRILDKIKIRNLITNKIKEVDITKNPFTIYISGIDVYGNIETVSRSDVNILMTVNPNKKQILLTSIPRDYYVRLKGTTGYKDKLTHAGNYGINMSIDTIEELLNIDINYYIRVNFTTLEKLIDSLDGVDVYSKYSFISYIDNYKFYTGYNHMNGKQALAFARERKSLPGGDNDRGINQEAVIEAIIRKVTSKSIIYNYTKILNNINGSFQTNLKDTDITRLIKKELSNIGGWNITSNNLTGKGSYDYTYSYSASKLYVTIPDIDSINIARELINKVINDELLDSSYDNRIENIKYPDKIEQSIPKEEKKEEVKEENKIEEDNKQEEVVDNNQIDNDEIDDILKDNSIIPDEENTDNQENNNVNDNNDDNIEDENTNNNKIENN